MMIRSVISLALVLALTPMKLSAQTRVGNLADAEPGEFRVFAGTSMRQPLESVLPDLQAKIGKPIIIEYGAVRGALHDEILAGQDFDVAILLPDTNAELARKGKLMSATYKIAEAPIALGLRGDAPAKLDVSTPAGLKSLLLGARSVKYTPTGAAIVTVKTIFAKLEIGDKVRDTSAQSAAVALAPGEYEITFYPYPEIAGNKALRNLGNVIAPLQVPAIFEAAIAAHAANPKEALTFVTFLQGPAIDAGLKASGLVKPR